MGICVKDKCTALAVGGHMVAPNNMCRPHLIEHVAPVLVPCEVLDGKVVGLDGVRVTAGGTVLLHPGETHIAQLEEAGIVRRKPAAKKPAAATS